VTINLSVSDVILPQKLCPSIEHFLQVRSLKMSNRWSPFTTPAPDRPSHHTNNQGTAFKNPWPSAEAPSWGEILQTKFPLGFYEDLAKKHPNTQDIKVVTPDWGVSSLESIGLSKERSIVGTYLGHAGVITEFTLEGTAVDGSEKKSFWVVYDPIFSSRAGPSQYTGPQRMKKPPCQVTDLPGMGFSRFFHVFKLLTQLRMQCGGDISQSLRPSRPFYSEVASQKVPEDKILCTFRQQELDLLSRGLPRLSARTRLVADP
jgi:hypothetical protein